MNFSSVTINGRQFTTLSAIENKLPFEVGKNYLFDLSYLSSLTVSGDRSAEFLQGQLSCDLFQVNANTFQHGAMCNLQGRVLALLDVINWHGFHLVLPKDLIPAIQFSLNKTAMLSKVKLEEAKNFTLYGFYLTNSNDLMPTTLSFPERPFGLSSNESACCYHLGQQLYLLLIQEKWRQPLIDQFSTKEQLRGSLAWHRLQLENKKIEIYPETRGLFLPHRIDLHQSGYLSFDKGCYKGQEIIARTHYRAKLKHCLDLFNIDTSEPIKAGLQLFSSSGDKEIGELIDYCPLGNNRYLIAASILFDAPKDILVETHKNPLIINKIEIFS